MREVLERLMREVLEGLMREALEGLPHEDTIGQQYDSDAYALPRLISSRRESIGNFLDERAFSGTMLSQTEDAMAAQLRLLSSYSSPFWP